MPKATKNATDVTKATDANRPSRPQLLCIRLNGIIWVTYG